MTKSQIENKNTDSLLEQILEQIVRLNERVDEIQSDTAYLTRTLDSIDNRLYQSKRRVEA